MYNSINIKILELSAMIINTVPPDEVVWSLQMTFGCRLWLTEQLYDGQSLVATVMIATAPWPWCFLSTAMLYGEVLMIISDGNLQLTSRCPLLKSLTMHTSRVNPSLSPDRWTGGARNANTSLSTPPKKTVKRIQMMSSGCVLNLNNWHSPHILERYCSYLSISRW